MSDSSLTAIGLAAIIVLVIANGLFVATEFSYVAVRRTRVEQLAAQGHGRVEGHVFASHGVQVVPEAGLGLGTVALRVR